ncbi:phospholipase D1-like [Tropilaelaps mercedesae]|uniref:phospholipase D n=1 Tax=Tropilaelaps mercedesae TaxID=418985 RepID=A0A1V9XWS8_9ACAR|nr:phospholipase D1-like [Tropilaelaps mercedesae]
MLYKKAKSALNINSFYSKRKVTELHKNIRVPRHPDHMKEEPPPRHENQTDSHSPFSSGIENASMSNASTKGQKIHGAVFSTPSVYFDQQLRKVVYPEASDHLSNGNTKLLLAKRRLNALIVFQKVARDMPRRSSVDIVDEISHRNTELIPNEEKLAPFVNEDARFWLGKDYTNFIFKNVTNMHQPFAEHIDRTRTPHMPWHDVGGLVIGRAARDLARHFIQRWNFVKNNKAKRNGFYLWLLPMSYNVAEEFNIGQCEAWFGRLYQCEVQALISASNCASEKFRVYIILPLLPAFEGEVGTPSGVSIQAITHWTYASLCRGQNSLIARLEEKMKNPREYVACFGLRKHDILNGVLVTEVVYVHSKLMIVDDCQAEFQKKHILTSYLQVIMGSANIKDCSLLGSRDSEVAALIRDQHYYSITFDGRLVKVGAYATSLRRWIFREHLGGFASVEDPVSDRFFDDTWRRIAESNTRILEYVFRPLPTNSVGTFAELRDYISQPSLAQEDPKSAIEELQKVIGHLVELPEKFLINQSPTPAPGTKEHLLPVALWT